MEIIINIDNFLDGGQYREINSPRTLESCLRSGLDPLELAPKNRSTFVSNGLTKEMVDIKYKTFENKRQDKINSVKNERNAIIKYQDRKKGIISQPNSPSGKTTAVIPEEKNGASNMLEQVQLFIIRPSSFNINVNINII